MDTLKFEMVEEKRMEGVRYEEEGGGRTEMKESESNVSIVEKKVWIAKKEKRIMEKEDQ